MSIKAPFSYMGGKSRIIHRYPLPTHDRIIEPFAGAAAYSFKYSERDIWLNDLDPITYAIWEWLTGGDRALTGLSYVPATVVAGTAVRDVYGAIDGCPGVGAGLLHLMRAEANQGTQGAKGVHDQITTIGAKCWNARFKRKTGLVIQRVRHWRVTQDVYTITSDGGPATWFIDPPYNNLAGSRYRQSSLDYDALGEWCKSRDGQVIVAEQVGATWLPFHELVHERQGMRGRYQRSRSGEAIWTNG